MKRRKLIVDCNNCTTIQAAELWGRNAQLGILQEECGELISAVSRLMRGRTDTKPVAEEMADVLVSMMSVIYLLDVSDDIHYQMIKKVLRLQNRIRRIDESTKV